jgi:hypothetical protein
MQILPRRLHLGEMPPESFDHVPVETVNKGLKPARSQKCLDVNGIYFTQSWYFGKFCNTIGRSS